MWHERRAWQGGVCGRGACVAEDGGMHGRAGVHGGSWRGVVYKAGKMATEVDGTRPTGMHSGFIRNSLTFYFVVKCTVCLF